MHVLVAYASKYGSTAEVAFRIGHVLSTNGIQAEVKPVKEVADIRTYRAVVMGSAVYFGRWRDDAVQFIKRNQEALGRMKVWLFSTGPTGNDDPENLLHGWKYPGELDHLIHRIKPEDVALFHGALDLDRLEEKDALAVRMVHAPEGDFRDWESIEQWALRIARGLQVV